jgi:fatty-acyl-CoA synthase
METNGKIEMDWLRKWTMYSPKSIAFKDADTGVEYSYSNLFHLACRLGSHLKATFGIRPGDRVAVFATNEIEFLPLFFAVQRLGAVLVPINFRLTGREVSHILSDSGASLLIAQKQFDEVLSGVEANALPQKTWSFDGKEGLCRFLADALKSGAPTGNVDDSASANAFAGDFESPCMILYTSGTTGAPKGAIITNKMLHWNSLNTTLRLNLSQNDVSLSFLPFFHTGGWNVLVTPFVHRGARTILMKKFEPQRVLELCEKERVTILFGVPTTMDMMFRTQSFESADLSSVRYAIVGGEPMPIELIRAWEKKGVPVRQGYGLTEFGPNVFSLNEEDSVRKIGSIGFPNFYIETRVVDDHGRDLQAGEIGELLLRGPVCTPGYWKNAEATTQTIRDGWLHTGDLVRVDEEGYFYVAGRKKDMFISGGENVYPVEVERFLSTHPAVREVAVIGVPDAKWGEVGKAFVALNEGFELRGDELISFCAGNLAKYKIPKLVEILPELPKGDSGKILKRKLRE